MSQSKHPHTGDFDDWCDENRPHPLSAKEWVELMQIPKIRESWGVEEGDSVETFSNQVYAAKFHFHSGSPGYVGDLYILQGDVLTGHPPFVVIRGQNGHMELA